MEKMVVSTLLGTRSTSSKAMNGCQDCFIQNGPTSQLRWFKTSHTHASQIRNQHSAFPNQITAVKICQVRRFNTVQLGQNLLKSTLWFKLLCITVAVDDADAF
jgi:hypothetical protein